MKIITDLYAYGFHLFVSYLNGGLEIFPFTDNSHSPYTPKIGYLDKIVNGSNLNELQGVNHVLYGTQNLELKRFDLSAGNRIALKDSTEIDLSADNRIALEDSPEIDKENISQIAIKHDPKRLFTFSNKKGFSEIDISNKYNPKFIRHYIPHYLETIGQPVISNLVPSNDFLLVAIRNFGVSGIPLNDTKRSEYRLERIIRTTDPQDAKKIKQRNLIVIADSEEGLIFYDLKNQEILSKVLLPNSDFPQQIEIMHSNILIKGSKGIYIFNFKLNKIRVLHEGKAGSIATYYDYIFFSSRGKIYGLSVNSSFEKRNFSLQTQKLEFELRFAPQ